MKSYRSLRVAATAALFLLAFAGSASATTLTIGGVKQNSAVTLKASLMAGTSTLWTTTFGEFINTCTSSSLEGKTSVFTGTTVSGPLSGLLFNSCTEGSVVVDAAGSFTIESIAGTANGTVRSTGTKVTVPSFIDATLPCETNNTDIGVITGVTSGSAKLDVTAILNCGVILPSVKWQGTYVITSPASLGVAS